jgi:hypothetical protein
LKGDYGQQHMNETKSETLWRLVRRSAQDEDSGRPEEARRRLHLRSMEVEGLRRRLLDDPKGTIEQEVDVILPEGIEVRAVEETPDTNYPVLPPRVPFNASKRAEHSDAELEAVAGAGGCRRKTSPARPLATGAPARIAFDGGPYESSERKGGHRYGRNYK